MAVRVRALAGQLTQVAVGTSNVTPSSRDRRFADPAWIENPLLQRLVQTYLAVSEILEAVLQDVSMEYRDADRA